MNRLRRTVSLLKYSKREREAGTKCGQNVKLVEKHRKRRKRQLKRVNKKRTAGKIGKNQSGGRNGKSPANCQIKLGFGVNYFGDT